MPDPAIDPEDRDALSYNWGGLAWSDWVPFNADKHAFHEIPPEPGVYRIRPAGKDFLMYVGSTGQSLHTKLSGLRQALRRADIMPWSDPHPEAPALWAWWIEWLQNQEDEKKLQVSSNSDRSSDLEDEKNMKCSSSSEWITEEEQDKVSSIENSGPAEENPDGDDETAEHIEDESAAPMLECSAAPLDASAAGRKAMEAFLLYRYRQEYGESTLCNFGRFHPRYRKSTNRKEGKRGGRLEDDQKDNPAGWPSIGSLEAVGKPGDPDWMGLEWTEWEPLVPEKIAGVAEGAGLYLLADAGSHEIVYIGQSANVGKRLLDNSRKSWDGRALVFSYQIVGQVVLPHNLRELENDLIGNYFEQYRKAPEFQFGKGR